jgi:oligopeptide transport system substrate-binding protein
MKSLRAGACALAVTLFALSWAGSARAADQPNACGKEGNATISYNGTEPENPLVPGNTTETGGIKVIGALFTGLVRYDSVTGQPHNAVAKSITTHDSRVYTIRLNAGWTFHDGTPVTAASFARAWNYTAYGPQEQGGASFLREIKGFDAVNAAKPTTRTMSGLKVVNRLTLRVTLSRPSSVFPMKLGYAAFMPLPRSFFTDEAGFERHPIGDGPFRYVSRDPGHNIVVKRYERYGGPCKPHVKGVQFRFYSSLDDAYADVVANKLDYLEITPASALADNKFVKDLPGRHVNQTYLGVQTISFPLYDARYQSPLLRRAISMAIDRQAVIRNVFNGLKQPADGFVPPNVPGRTSGQCGQLCTYQPALARQLFAESGFQGPIQLVSNDDSANQDWMEAACVSITQALGRECTFIAMPTLGAFRTAITAHQMSGIYRSGWVADYPSIEDFLSPLYRSGGSDNNGGYSNPTVDRLLDEADAALSEKQSDSLYQRAERQVLRDMPAVPLWFQTVQSDWSKRLHHVIVTPFRELDLFSVRAS